MGRFFQLQVHEEWAFFSCTSDWYKCFFSFEVFEMTVLVEIKEDAELILLVLPMVFELRLALVLKMVK
jgi:hypothetical protein